MNTDLFNENNDDLWRTIVKVSYELMFFKDDICQALNISSAVFKEGTLSNKISLNNEQILRLSFLLQIYQSMTMIFRDQAQAHTWSLLGNRSHPFDGKSPKEMMTGGKIKKLRSVAMFMVEHVGKINHSINTI